MNTELTVPRVGVRTPCAAHSPVWRFLPCAPGSLAAWQGFFFHLSATSERRQFPRFAGVLT